MKKLRLISLVGFFLYLGCTTVIATADMSTDEAMLNFLPYLNQKVTGYLDAHNTNLSDTKTYKNIVTEVCSPLPSCGKHAEVMFNSYNIQIRMLDGIFSVMLCNKEGTVKKMEDFSCNEQKVEVPNFQTDPEARCDFQNNWKEKIAPHCPMIK